RFAKFNNYINRPKVFYKEKIYSFPINLMTLYQLWGVKTPKEAAEKLNEATVAMKDAKNLEEWILSQAGEEIYNIFIKGYTTKQWGKKPKDLPVSIIKRIPIRLTFNDNYYDDKYQGIPKGGYTEMFKKMLSKVEVKLNTNYFDRRNHWDSAASVVLYTGKIDEYFDYKFGELEYRSLKFDSKVFEGDYQGNAVINYTDEEIPYTRVIEHKHFTFDEHLKTVVTWEYPEDYNRGKIPYYPINTVENNKLYKLYKSQASKIDNLILGGRLASYSYLDMDDVIAIALESCESLSS
ncbi:MAG: UDP-galactopyranose/dTDP-fucopyranose mutase family protein, partial [Planctomycetota bacterium]